MLGVLVSAQAVEPVIKSIAMVDGTPQFEIESKTGLGNQIQCSTTLSGADWLVLTNLAVMQTPYRFADVSGSIGPCRFYRVLVLGPNDLTGFVEMPPAPNGEWVLSSPYGSGRAWGREEMIRHLWIVCREWHRRYPDRSVVRIGDISQPDGSPFEHATHTSGLNADIKTLPTNIVDMSSAQQDQPLQLAELLYTFGATTLLYGMSKSFDEIPVVVAFDGHDTHFHDVVNPANVPSNGDWVFMPRPVIGADGSTQSNALSIELSCELLGIAEDRTGGWSIVSPSVLSEISFQIADIDDTNGVGMTSLPLSPANMTVKVQWSLLIGKAQRWRIDLVTPSGQRKQSWWYVIEAPEGSGSTLRCAPILADTTEIPLHFTILTENPASTNRTTLSQIQEEVAALNTEYAMANPLENVTFVLASVCNVEYVRSSGSPLAEHIDAMQGYDGGVWSSHINNCNDPNIVSPSAINIFLNDDYTLDRGFAPHSTWTRSNSGRPYIIMDWAHTLSAGAISDILPDPVAVEGLAQNFHPNFRLLRNAPSAH